MQRLAHDVAVTPPTLLSIWIAVIPFGGAGDLEIHVAEMVLVAQDIGEHADLLAFLDQAHRDTRDRAI